MATMPMKKLIQRSLVVQMNVLPAHLPQQIVFPVHQIIIPTMTNA